MSQPSYVLLYVDSAARSEAFYTDLLGRKPVESSPNFALFVLESGLKLGLWSQAMVEPKTTAVVSGSELAVSVETDVQVRAIHSEWARRGLSIAQDPTHMDFGYTFVALDPDGHRLRVFAPN
jgi:catechol 2,3-dioxygenase-like lactoylglutathione lyase family enzyme